MLYSSLYSVEIFTGQELNLSLDDSTEIFNGQELNPWCVRAGYATNVNRMAWTLTSTDSVLTLICQ